MADGEGGGAGDCRAIFLGGEEGESRDRHIHHASWIFPKQVTLCHQEDGAYRIRSPQRRPFRFGKKFPWILHIFISGLTRGGGRQVQIQVRRRDSPAHTPFRQSSDHCDGGWHYQSPLCRDISQRKQQPFLWECHAVWLCLAYPLINQLWISWRQSLESEWELPCW